VTPTEIGNLRWTVTHGKVLTSPVLHETFGGIMTKISLEELAAHIGVLAGVQYKLIGMLRANGAVTHEQTTTLLDILDESFKDTAEAVKAAIDQAMESSIAE
jgi:hypothetical protein